MKPAAGCGTNPRSMPLGRRRAVIRLLRHRNINSLFSRNNFKFIQSEQDAHR
ncbi:hypothetical protein [Lysobacter gummosus]|uniref:hypothetical protein n=1 Tax=Lysobacter gummosus TaxID=262324 RepID=UPI00363914C8